MVFVFFKAKFQRAVCNEDVNQGKYNFWGDIFRRDEKQEALHKLNNIMRHGDFYDVICLPPQGEDTLDMIAVFKQRTDVVSIDNILTDEYENIWKVLQVSYEDSDDENEMDYHVMVLVNDSVKSLTWEEAGHLIYDSYCVDDRYARCEEYSLSIVTEKRYKNDE